MGASIKRFFVQIKWDNTCKTPGTKEKADKLLIPPNIPFAPEERTFKHFLEEVLFIFCNFSISTPSLPSTQPRFNINKQ